MGLISSDTVIKYSDLTDYIFSLIISNVDNISPNLPISNETITTPINRFNKTVTINDSYLVSVSENEIKTELNDFMKSRGLYSCSGYPVSYKFMLNFFNSVSSFLATKLVVIPNPNNLTKSYLYYVKSRVNFENLEDMSLAANSVKTISYDKKYIFSMLSSISNSVRNLSHIHFPNMTLSFASSSCSSSSSSSSCSSSSSSLFIAYMNI